MCDWAKAAVINPRTAGPTISACLRAIIFLSRSTTVTLREEFQKINAYAGPIVMPTPTRNIGANARIGQIRPLAKETIVV